MCDDTYNGWKNRETWAFNLHWSNDQGLYGYVLETGRDYLTETYGDEWAQLPEDEMRGAQYGVGEHVVTTVRDYLDGMAEELGDSEYVRMVSREVGSWWRVDSAETGAAVLESLGNES